MTSIRMITTQCRTKLEKHVVVKHGEAQVDPSVMPEMFL
jgi:hypothetical protein